MELGGGSFVLPLCFVFKQLNLVICAMLNSHNIRASECWLCSIQLLLWGRVEQVGCTHALEHVRHPFLRSRGGIHAHMEWSARAPLAFVLRRLLALGCGSITALEGHAWLFHAPGNTPAVYIPHVRLSNPMSLQRFWL